MYAGRSPGNALSGFSLQPYVRTLVPSYAFRTRTPLPLSPSAPQLLCSSGPRSKTTGHQGTPSHISLLHCKRMTRFPSGVRTFDSGGQIRAREWRGVTLLSAGWPQAGPSRQPHPRRDGEGQERLAQPYYPLTPGFPQDGVLPQVHLETSMHSPVSFQDP